MYCSLENSVIHKNYGNWLLIITNLAYWYCIPDWCKRGMSRDLLPDVSPPRSRIRSQHAWGGRGKWAELGVLASIQCCDVITLRRNNCNAAACSGVGMNTLVVLFSFLTMFVPIKCVRFFFPPSPSTHANIIWRSVAWFFLLYPYVFSHLICR